MKAFPYDPKFNGEHNGMDLADYFAAKAMQAILAGNWNVTQPGEVAVKAYTYAQAMCEVKKARDLHEL